MVLNCADIRSGDLITFAQACEQYDLSKNTLYDWTKKKKIAFERANNKLLIYTDSLLMMLRLHTPRPSMRSAAAAEDRTDG